MKKIIGMGLSMLFFGTMLTPMVLAGSENDPEITDEEKDVSLYTIYHGPFVNAVFKNVDLLSCWFYEDPAEPQNFYITMKIRSIRFGFFNTTYVVGWECSGKPGFAVFSQSFFNRKSQAYVGFFNDSEDYKEYRYETQAQVDATTHTVTIMVPKQYIANLEAGDVLSYLAAGILLIPHLKQMIPDASVIAFDTAIGETDYTIQY